jgi:ribosomal protein S18 acetylase RimI-like enzyme
MEKAIKIRKARPADAKILYRLSGNMEEMLGSKEMSHYTLKEIRTWIKKEDKLWLVAEIAKGKKVKTIGFLFAMFVSHEWCIIDSIGVKDGYRGMGIGKLIFENLTKICKKRKIHYLQSLVDIKNKPAQKFWQSSGFQKGKTFIWIDREL